MTKQDREFFADPGIQGHGSSLPGFSLLDFFGFDDHLRKRESQTVCDGLSRVQIRASLPALQKSNVGLVESGLGSQG